MEGTKDSFIDYVLCPTSLVLPEWNPNSFPTLIWHHLLIRGLLGELTLKKSEGETKEVRKRKKWLGRWRRELTDIKLSVLFLRETGWSDIIWESSCQAACKEVEISDSLPVAGLLLIILAPEDMCWNEQLCQSSFWKTQMNSNWS